MGGVEKVRKKCARSANYSPFSHTSFSFLFFSFK